MIWFLLQVLEMIETTFECHPQPKMKKGDKCWCLSGYRWKDCHMNRAKLPKITLEDTHKAEVIARQNTQCLHPDAPHNCSGNTIRSHSVQKNASLKAIAKNNHVLSMGTMSWGEMEKKGDVKSIIKIKKLGINKASTFPGFCNHHDTELFKPVEKKGWKHSKRNAFLLSLRAISLEYFKKKSVISFIEWCLKNSDKGYCFEDQAAKQINFRSSYISFKYGCDDLYKCLNRYKEIYHSNDFSDYNYLCIEFDKKCPVVSCGAFAPEYDFFGVPLQSMTDLNIEEISINVYSLEESSLCIIGYLNGPAKVGKKFTESLLALPHQRIPDIILQLALSSFENTYFNEDWYNNLEKVDQKKLEIFLDNNAYPDIETDSTYLVDCGWHVFDGEISNIYENIA